MEIRRFFEDGTQLQITLTDDEVEQAYRERRRYYNRCDLIHKMDLHCDGDGYDGHLSCADDGEYEFGKRTVTGKQLNELIADKEFISDLVDEFEDALDNNDSYWESFWGTADYVIENMIDERVPKSLKEIRQDANRKKYATVIDVIQRAPFDYTIKAELIDKLINEDVEEDK